MVSLVSARESMNVLDHCCWAAICSQTAPMVQQAAVHSTSGMNTLPARALSRSDCSATSTTTARSMQRTTWYGGRVPARSAEVRLITCGEPILATRRPAPAVRWMVAPFPNHRRSSCCCSASPRWWFDVAVVRPDQSLNDHTRRLAARAHLIRPSNLSPDSVPLAQCLFPTQRRSAPYLPPLAHGRRPTIATSTARSETQTPTGERCRRIDRRAHQAHIVLKRRALYKIARAVVAHRLSVDRADAPDDPS